MNHCVYAPSKGTDTFYKLKEKVGYDKAWDIIGVAMNPKFQRDFKDTLSYDSEGVPTLSSLLSNPYIQNMMGTNNTMKILQEQFSPKEDNLNNFGSLVQQAAEFNKTNPHSSKYVAYVDYNDDGKIIVKITPRTETAAKKFQDQFGAYTLNKGIATLLQSLGVSIDTLSQLEVAAGRTGVTDFSKARDIATSLISMIKIANNMEGAMSLSEEFAHLVIGITRDNPLVSRSIAALSNDEQALRQILGDEYDDTVEFHNQDMSLVAEEALGKILQNKLKVNFESKSISILQRALNFIKNLFKSIKEDSVYKIMADAESSMNDLAKGLFSGETQITREDIANSQRDVQFNNLSDRIQRNINLLKKLQAVEAKRGKMNLSSPRETTQRITSLTAYTQDQADTALGLFLYAQTALSDLKAAYDSIDEKAPGSMGASKKDFVLLRTARNILQSYGKFVTDLTEILNDEYSEEDNLFILRDITMPDGTVIKLDIDDVMKELNTLMKKLSVKYRQRALPLFAAFLKPVLGESITFTIGQNAGKTFTVEEILNRAETDISFMDRWLDSMGDSSDILLQAFDAVAKDANDHARYEAIKRIRSIQALRIKAESMGITSFDWMFERYRDGGKTGNYISEVNEAQYRRDVEEFEKQLEEKYGKNPKGEKALEKLNERKKWLDAHSTYDVYGFPSPDKELYKNKDYQNLTAQQKAVLEEFISLKRDIEKKLPKNRVSYLKAVQQRKGGLQRFLDSTSSPETILDNIKEHLASEFLEVEDDDAVFGEITKKGVIDFAGNEIMYVPLLYTNRLNNPDELSDDVFGSLISYAAMAERYKELTDIVDALEVGKSLMEDRKIVKTRGGKKVKERFEREGIKVDNEVLEEEGSNIAKKLQDFMESQIYGRYLKDQGGAEIFGKTFNYNKITSWVLKMGSSFQLGLNFLANLANVNTGIAMQNIEAAAREFFTAKELLKADGIYMSELPAYLGELEARTKTSKLALVDEMFNVKGTFFSDVRRTDQRKNLLRRIFGKSLMFIGQECGDHWLYNRTLIAMMQHEEVTVPGKGKMNLWDALEVVDAEEGQGLKELKLPIGTLGKDGEEFDISAFSRKVLKVNQGLFGIYNEEDQSAANRVIAGRIVLQYRKWMKAQFNKRFQKSQMSLALGREEEGYYRTVVRVINDLRKGQVHLGSVMSSLSPHEQANIRRAIFEMIQLLAVVALIRFIPWSDDKKRPWALKLAEYSLKRCQHEFGNLAPSPIMVQEMLKTVKSPAASISMLQDLTRLATSALDPADWFDETQSGPYKGMSTLEKNFLRAPLPGIAQYRQISKFTGEIDNTLIQYGRSY